MTAPYEYNPMPRLLAVRCPNCAREARFAFVTVAQINRRRDMDYFRRSDHFDVISERSGAGTLQHFAVHYHGLRSRSLAALDDLPEGYAPSDWSPEKETSRWRTDQTRELGTLICPHCHTSRRHELDWPRDAWYRTEYRGQLLWAFNREMAGELKTYIEARDRERSHFRFRLFLMKVPGHFLSRKARGAVVKKLDRLLAD